MATSYLQQATQQLNPSYQQQQQALLSQIPAIQNLYQTLTQGAQQQSQQQIKSGTQNILESAASRGVLRSTLPVDAQQALEAQIGSALQQSLGQYGAQQAQDIAKIRGQAGQLGVDRATAIQNLAQTLAQSDLQKQNNALEKEKIALARAQLYAPSTSSRSPSQAERTAALRTSLSQDISGFFAGKNANQKNYTENVVIPKLVQAYPELTAQQIFDAVYPARKALLGF